MRLGVSNGKWSNGPGEQITDTERNTIGTQGAPKSIAEAVVGTNPHYSPEYREYSENCQRCVVAYELQRRGYDVEALPTYRGDTLTRVRHVDQNNIYRGAWLGAFQDEQPVSVGVAGNNAGAEQAVMRNIDSKMQEYGNGARAVVQIFYRSGGGHVFNVENQNGRTTYVEAQSGQMKNMATAMKRVETGSVNLVRTDNLRISGRINNFVKQKN